ncbi:MAG: hypothetical protein ACREGA_02460 [Candidatus Saccharimonadales bacterium]
MKPKLLAHRSFWFAAGLSAASASIGLLGGLGLQETQNSLVSFAPLLIALPALHAAAGNYAAIISAHLSDPQLYPQRLKRLIKALGISLPVSVIGVSAISLLVTHLQGYRFGLHQALGYIIFYASALIGVVLIIFLASFITNKTLQKHQINSDDILVSVMNNAASVLMLLCFALVARFYF